MIMQQTKKGIVFLLFIVVIAITVSFILIKNNSYYFESSYYAPVIEISQKSEVPEISKVSEVFINDTRIIVDLARTSQEIQKGLSGRPSLAPQNGMLFIFPTPSIYSFWMPDMNFPLDLIWINNGVIVDISHNVTNVFNKNNPVYYRPKKPAQYVLEVNANFSVNNNIKIGDSVIFKNISI